MKRFTIGLVAALVLTVGGTSFITPARGQGLVEYALILCLVAVDEGQPAKLLWYPDADRGRDARAIQRGGTFVLTYIATNAIDAGPQACRQSGEVSIAVGDGINSMRVALGSNRDSIGFNGQYSAALDPCFAEPGDVVVEIGVPLPPEATTGLRGPGPLPPPPGVAAGKALFFPIVNQPVGPSAVQFLPGGGYVVRTGG
jgi:hypothetical protein